MTEESKIQVEDTSLDQEKIMDSAEKSESTEAIEATETQQVQDPHAAREADKYDNPVPSREFILALLEKEQRPLRLKQITSLLNIEDDERFEGVSRRLKAMVRDNQIMRNRRGCFALIQKMDLVKGTVMGHAAGFGFVVPDEGGDDLFLSDREMYQVFHGDKVLASVVGLDKRGRKEGHVVEVLEHSHEQIMGRLHFEDGLAWVQPSNNRIAQDIFIPSDGLMEAKEGQIVVIEILHRPSSRTSAIGKIISVAGDYLSSGMEIETAIHAFGIPNEWSEDLITELNAIPDEVQESDLDGRKDVRNLNLVTIDGADSKDFDDAVYTKKRKNGWRLVVAIADVSHYVKPGSALDKEAYKRGNSVYFPQQVVPMLPEKLSNGLCSLNPKVDRLCMICDMSIDETGKLERSQFYQAVMNSKARLTYNQVFDMLENPKSEHRETFKDVVSDVEELNNLYQVLKKARAERGALEFDTTETSIVFDDERKIKEIVPVFRNEAHKIIEECMLMANVATARYLKWHKIPMLYRVHDKPKEVKLESLKTFLADFGIQLGGGDAPTGHDFAEVAQKAKGQPYEHLVQTVLLRSMNQAVYSPDNKGHFGLNYELYTHFTSPIRRYPDLLIHRGIRFAWTKQAITEFNYTDKDMESLGQHCTDMEHRADEATRDVVTFLKCEYLSHHLGEEFTAVVTAATNFGLFVELESLYVEGLVHITELGEDYFHYDNARHCLKGERTGIVYRLGDKIRVQVAQVNLDDRKVDLKFLERLTGQNDALEDADQEIASNDDDDHEASKEKAPKKRRPRNNRNRSSQQRNRKKNAKKAE